MPIRRGNQRETSSQKARDYADAVIEFMDTRGYRLDARAEDSGELEDLVFIPKAGNRTPVVGEAKYRDPDSGGISPNDYVEGFAKRFRQWNQGAYEGYEFQLFTSKLSNDQLWDDLVKHIKSDEVEVFYEKMVDQSSGSLQEFLGKHEPSRFERFLEHTVVWGDYSFGDFERMTDRARQTGEYDFDPYEINFEPVDETSTHKSNLLEITGLPPTLYFIEAADGLSTSEFYQHNPHDYLPLHFHDGLIFSLIHPSELDDETRDMCDLDGVIEEDFQAFSTSNPTQHDVNISKVLLRGVLSMFADKVGAVVNRERNDTRVYMEHEGTDRSVGNKWVTRELETGEVRHRSVSIFVRYFSDAYFYGLYPTVEFTEDGRNLVSGARKKYLSDRFNPGKFPQNKRKSQTVEIWLSELALEESLGRFVLPDNLKYVTVSRVQGLELPGVRPPASGEERDQLVEDQIERANTTNL